MTPTALRSGFQASRAACAGTILLVFLTGAIAGAVAMNLGGHKFMHRSAPFWTAEGKQISLQKWQRELNLTTQQTQDLESILDDFGLYYRNVLSDGKSRILKILDEDQKRKFNRLLEAQR